MSGGLAAACRNFFCRCNKQIMLTEHTLDITRMLCVEWQHMQHIAILVCLKRINPGSSWICAALVVWVNPISRCKHRLVRICAQ